MYEIELLQIIDESFFLSLPWSLFPEFFFCFLDTTAYTLDLKMAEALR